MWWRWLALSEVADLALPPEAQWRQALEARHGAAIQEKFSRAVVAICGLGGLGSNIAVALARAGVGTLILIDFDRVDLTNLNRQQYKASQLGREKALALAENLREICPYVTLQPHALRITQENLVPLLAGADIICEAFDVPEAKAMLVNGVLEAFPGKYLVAASGMAGLGSGNAIRTRRVTSGFYLCGDGVSDTDAGLGLFAPRVALCANHQALMILRLLAGEEEP